MKFEYAVQIIWSPEDNAYLAVPAELPGCMADGKTPEEALANLRVVIDEWISVAKEDGREIPNPMNIQDLTRIQQEAQSQLREHIQKHIENEVKNAVGKVLNQLALAQPPSSVWDYRGRVAGFYESEDLTPAGHR